MYINPDWRVLTVGDGDLSFSLAVLHQFSPKHLVATVFDDIESLRRKYGGQHLEQLRHAGIEVLTEFDVTAPQTWSSLPLKAFDLVIFQFPLIPAVGSQQAFVNGPSVNTRNRALLRYFLRHSFDCFLDPVGASLAYMSSKEVKPYIEWDIERSLHVGLRMSYLGKHPFDFNVFPGYRMRNVDRDKHVKHTQAYTHIWSQRPWSYPHAPIVSCHYQIGSGCDICQAGPFTTEQEATGHRNGKRHKRLLEFERQWQDFLKQESLDN